MTRDRWSEGIPHHPAAEWLVKQLAKVDFNQYGDYFCWKTGGDGDNGETLMYEIDEILDDPQLKEELKKRLGL